jgi:3-isopropylmalate/(R)-2-methylmalate dehydratase small subunit
MNITGKALILGDDINTDFIISGRYKFAITDIKELAKHIMEDIDPDFYKKIDPGRTILVAGRNFGMGSSREQAPLVIKESGITAVLAKSFARIFYRNGFNNGVPLLDADTSNIRQGDLLELDLDKGIIKDVTQDFELEIKPLPKIMQELLKSGGLMKYYKEHNDLPVV